MTTKYILKNGNPVRCDDVIEWGRWLETADRHVALTELPGDVRVSTVFLGLDHNFSNGSEPVLFESMIFGGTLDGEQERYNTREEAEQGHKELVARAETKP